MKRNVLLTITSLLSILFMTFHFTDDVVRGLSPGSPTLSVAVPTLVLWLYGTLVLTERRSGYIIILIGSLFAIGMPIIHLAGIGKSSGFFFVWTLMVLGMTAIITFILAVQGLWNLRESQSR